jgi:hypothetical protein
LAYKTIFEEVKEKSNQELKGTPSREWYRTQVFSAKTIQYENDPTKLIRQENYDQSDNVLKRDQNTMRVFPKLFSLMLFQYKAKYREELPYYDKYPLAFVLDFKPKSFFAVNLHYYKPEQRIGIVQSLIKNKIPRFETGAHKYLLSEVKTPYLDLAEAEWETICVLPLEEFVMDLGGVEIPIPSNKVWGR